MAFELIEKYRIYHCESGDTKKTTDIEVGSFCFESDTGLRYIFNGTSWVEYPESVQIGGSNGNVDTLPTNGATGLVTIEPNHISTLNSTTTPLGIDATFTGIGEDITNYAIMFINVHADVDSATDGLCIDASYDGNHWHQTECYTILANTYKTVSIQCASRYIRIRYKNGGVAQTEFHMEVKLCTKNALDSSHRIADNISDQDDATLNKSVLTAQQPNLTFVNIGSTASGNLKTTDAENPLAISKGEVVGAEGENKWGNAPDFDTADGQIDVWDGAEDNAAWEQMTYVFSDTNDIDSISSTDAGDTEIVNIEALRDGLPVSFTVTLNGQNKVNFTGVNAINRMYNSNGTVFAGHIIAYVDTAISGGVPTDTTKIRAIIHPEEQQTEMAIYTVPNGTTAYVYAGYGSTAGGNKSSNYITKFKAQSPNGVFRTQQKISVSDAGSSFVTFNYPFPQKFEAGTRLKVSVQMTASGATGASFSAGFSLVLIDD